MLLVFIVDIPDTDDERAEQGDDVVDFVLRCPAVDEQAHWDEGATCSRRV